MQFCNLKQLILETEDTGNLIPTLGLSGYSGKKIIGLLQRFARFQEANGGGGYLEIGVFQGLSLISVANALSNERAFGIDNFSQFDKDHKNQNMVLERMALNNIKNAVLINLDFEDGLMSLGDYIQDSRIGLYFVDGPHDYRSQLLCLELIKPYLSKNAFIVVDDSNYRHVRQANHDFLINNPEFKLLYEAYTDAHPATMNEKRRKDAVNGWWNGINIIVKDKENKLAPMYPPTVKNRTLYYNEHILHSSKYAVLAPDALLFIGHLLNLSLIKALKLFVQIVIKSKRIPAEFVAERLQTNTFSDDLPKNNFNPSLKTGI